jgi:hypothetical protein
VDDAVKPVLDSGWKLDRLLGRNFTRERIFLSHTLNDKLHSQADSEELESTQAKIGHSRVGLGFGDHALRAV